MDSQSEITVPSAFPVKLIVPGFRSLYEGKETEVVVYPSLMTLVGPNGTGKTRMLRNIFEQTGNVLQSRLGARKTRYLAAGRGSPFERFRADVDGPGHRDHNDAAVGQRGFKNTWNRVESVTGDYLALEQRPDLRLKVEARLQQLFSRSLSLQWGQSGLAVFITPMSGGDSYSASHEASGILQLVALLAAIHNDEIGLLAIDEPEISLHPQHQAFLLREMLSVAGDPALDPTKKLILLATHSPSMLSIKSVADISRIIFFSHSSRQPVQSEVHAPELATRKIKALIARLSATHSLAFFANTVFLVEGPSDEIITTQLTDRIEHPLLSQNAQIVPVIGKGEFVQVAKLFRMLGKRVTVMADLDALTDSNELVNFFSTTDHDKLVASAKGHDSIVSLDTQIRCELMKFISTHWAAIEPIASNHAYWRDCPAHDRTDETKKRAALACLLVDAEAYKKTAAPIAEWQALRMRFCALLDMLEKCGCHLLRRGTIESYYSTVPSAVAKPEAAAEEASTFGDCSVAELGARYADVLRAVADAAPIRPVDESELLREKLGAALGAVLQSVKVDATAEQIAAKVQSIMGIDAPLFGFENISSAGTLRLKVSIRSPLFIRDTFPFEISETDNLVAVIRDRLPR